MDISPIRVVRAQEAIDFICQLSLPQTKKLRLNLPRQPDTPSRHTGRRTKKNPPGTERACKIAPLRAAHDSGLRLGSPSKTRPPCHPRYGRSFFASAVGIGAGDSPGYWL